MENNYKAAWVAALLEGEGCFTIAWKTSTTGQLYPAFNVACNMCDEDVIQRLIDWSGFGRLSDPYVPKKPHHKPVFRWAIHKRSHVEKLVLSILPYMGIRRTKRITEILDAMKQFPPRSVWRHGTRQGYERGCRCVDCKRVHAKRFRDIRQKRKTDLIDQK